MKELDSKVPGKQYTSRCWVVYAVVPVLDIVVCASSLLKDSPVRGVPGDSIDLGTGQSYSVNSARLKCCSFYTAIALNSL